MNDEQIKMAKQPVQVPIAESGATSWRPYQAAPQSEYKQQPSFGGSRSSVVQQIENCFSSQELALLQSGTDDRMQLSTCDNATLAPELPSFG